MNIWLEVLFAHLEGLLNSLSESYQEKALWMDYYKILPLFLNEIM